jgi:hypothetical protein
VTTNKQPVRLDRCKSVNELAVTVSWSLWGRGHGFRSDEDRSPNSYPVLVGITNTGKLLLIVRKSHTDQIFETGGKSL